MDQMMWYAELLQPTWLPPAWIFGPVWSVLYAVIVLSFGYVFYLAWRKRLSRKVALPFVLNLVFNLAFSPIQFGLRNNLLASVDIILVLVTLVWALVAVYPHARVVVLVNIPYLGWVGFATLLQLTITVLNR